MDKKGISRALRRGSGLLREHLPEDRTLDRPILCAACVWAGRRIFDLRKRVLAWQTWLEPGQNRPRPAAAVRRFFESHDGLARAYAAELAGGDTRPLRRAFAALYPVLGIEDPFLLTLFAPEIAAGDYRGIVAAFPARARAARDAIRRTDPELWSGLSEVAAELAACGVHGLSETEIRRLVARALEGTGHRPAAPAPRSRPRPGTPSPTR